MIETKALKLMLLLLLLLFSYFSVANVSSNMSTIPPTTVFTDAWKPRMREVIASCNVHFTTELITERHIRRYITEPSNEAFAFAVDQSRGTKPPCWEARLTH